MRLKRLRESSRPYTFATSVREDQRGLFTAGEILQERGLAYRELDGIGAAATSVLTALPRSSMPARKLNSLKNP